MKTLILILLSFICGIIFIIIRSLDEKKHYGEEMAMLKQQAQFQYEYYLQQEQKYNETIRILHDVDKHIRTIHELSRTGEAAATKDYAEQIRNTLRPLIPIAYTDNPILNILLSDRQQQTKEKGIRFDIDIRDVNFSFMDAMDITTIFGNLLDNSMEACESLPEGEEKTISLTAKKVREMIAVTLENDSGPVLWRTGTPVSQKGKNRGIGIRNVKRSIDKYDGTIKMRAENGKFITEFFVNIRNT